MENIYTSIELKEAIRRLEQQRSAQEQLLGEHFNEVVESLRPVNIIKRTVRDVFPDKQSKRHLLGSVIGLGTGLLTKKLLIGKSAGLFSRFLGNIAQWGIAAVISKNSEKIKDGGAALVKKILPHKNGTIPR